MEGAQGTKPSERGKGTNPGFIGNMFAWWSTLIYTMTFANLYGPIDTGTVKCLFSLDFTSLSSKNNHSKVIFILIVYSVETLLMIGGAWFCYELREKEKKCE